MWVFHQDKYLDTIVDLVTLFFLFGWFNIFNFNLFTVTRKQQICLNSLVEGIPFKQLHVLLAVI